MNLSDSWASLRRAASWHRRGLAALCAAGAVLASIAALSPDTRTVPVVVAAHDLAPGSTLAGGDLRVVEYPPGLAPPDALTSAADAVGGSPAAPVGAGTPVTRTSLAGPASLAGPGERLAAFRLPDQDLRDLIRVGDRITVVATTDDGQVKTLAARVRVVALPSTSAVSSLAASDQAGLVVVSCVPSVAEQIAAWSTSARLGVALG